MYRFVCTIMDVHCSDYRKHHVHSTLKKKSLNDSQTNEVYCDSHMRQTNIENRLNVDVLGRKQFTHF